MKKYFIGAEAGCIGYSQDGYPIHDHQLVLVKSDRSTKVKAIYQVQKVFGIIENGEFVEAKPKCENIANCASEPEYKMTYWVADEIIHEAKLKTQYNVLDVTDVVRAAEVFDGISSPYISTKCLDIFKRNRELNARNPEDKPIIAAVKAAMNR